MGGFEAAVADPILRAAAMEATLVAAAAPMLLPHPGPPCPHALLCPPAQLCPHARSSRLHPRQVRQRLGPCPLAGTSGLAAAAALTKLAHGASLFLVEVIIVCWAGRLVGWGAAAAASPSSAATLSPTYRTAQPTSPAPRLSPLPQTRCSSPSSAPPLCLSGELGRGRRGSRPRLAQLYPMALRLGLHRPRRSRSHPRPLDLPA